MLAIRIRMQAKDQQKMSRQLDYTQCYRDIFRAGCRDDIKMSRIREEVRVSWEEWRERRTIRRFAALKFHDYVGSNFGWSRGWCSYAASLSICVLRATEGGDKGCEAGEGRKGGFVRPSGINGRENECHLFRNTHPENYGAGEKFTEKATLKKGDEIP